MNDHSTGGYDCDDYWLRKDDLSAKERKCTKCGFDLNSTVCSYIIKSGDKPTEELCAMCYCKIILPEEDDGQAGTAEDNN